MSRASWKRFQKSQDIVPNCVVTDGPAGAYIRWNDKDITPRPKMCEPKDLTGAGDMFAARSSTASRTASTPAVAGQSRKTDGTGRDHASRRSLAHGARRWWKASL